jgi:hypothetical protein
VNIHHHHSIEPAFERTLVGFMQAFLTQGEKIMDAIADFATKTSAFFDRQDKAITDIQTEVEALNDQITALQNSNGTITPSDQALLDGIQTRASTVAVKLEQLDSLTPPVVPPASTPTP